MQVTSSSVTLSAISFQGLRTSEIAAMIIDLVSRGVPLYIDEKIYRDLGETLKNYGIIVERVGDISDNITGIVLRSIGSNVKTMNVRIEVYDNGVLVTTRTLKYARLKSELLNQLGAITSDKDKQGQKVNLPTPLYRVRIEQPRKDN